MPINETLVVTASHTTVGGKNLSKTGTLTINDTSNKRILGISLSNDPHTTELIDEGELTSIRVYEYSQYFSIIIQTEGYTPAVDPVYIATLQGSPYLNSEYFNFFGGVVDGGNAPKLYGYPDEDGIVEIGVRVKYSLTIPNGSLGEYVFAFEVVDDPSYNVSFKIAPNLAGHFYYHDGNAKARAFPRRLESFRLATQAGDRSGTNAVIWSYKLENRGNVFLKLSHGTVSYTGSLTEAHSFILYDEYQPNGETTNISIADHNGEWIMNYGGGEGNFDSWQGLAHTNINITDWTGRTASQLASDITVADTAMGYVMSMYANNDGNTAEQFVRRFHFR